MTSGFKIVIVALSTGLVALLLIGAVLGQSNPSTSSDPYRHIHVYTEVFAKIKSDYVEEPDMKSVTLGAINGLLVSVDPFASYLNADQFKQYQKAKTSEKAGLGLVLSRKYGYEIGIVDAIPGSPADKAGLSTGDIIEAINGVSTRDMPLAYADVMLHGEPGSTVELTVLRLRKPEPTKLTLTRAEVKTPELSAKMIDDNTGYISVQDLRAGSSAKVASALRDLDGRGAKKMILDLRHSVTGDVEEGYSLANLFLEKGVAGSLSGQRVPKKVFEMDPERLVYKGELLVLTNRGTAGAAEVAAAALLENKRAKVVGERSYGDAALRKPVPTEDGGAVILATAKYYTPSGKSIQENHVVPTYPVADTDTDQPDETEVPPPGMPNAPKPEAPAAPKTQEDQILKKAIEVLNGGGTVQAGNQRVAPNKSAEPGSILTPLGVPKPVQP
jgi:carboxyl-terminal processing protease